MLQIVFLTATTLYGFAGSFFLAQLVGAGGRTQGVQPDRAPSWSLRLLVLAAGFHLAHDILRWATEGLGPFASIREALSTLGLLVVAGFLAARAVQQRTEVVGAFVTPVSLLLLLASRAPMARGDEHFTGALFALHVGSTLVATAAFTVAFGMAVAYLLQEREVKRKRLAGLFRRLPPLEILDDLGYRCVAVGLPALTVGMIAGYFFGARSGAVGALGQWRQYVAVVAWGIFAAVLFLRMAVGWRGRRAAYGTILGYASAVLVLVGYFLRGSSP